MDELLPDILKARIPMKLAQEIEERYTTLGLKYMTEQRWDDGRLINACMFTNRIENALEEIIDAVFCVLGWILKYRQLNRQIPDSAYHALIGMIELYALLTVEKEVDAIA